MEIVREILIAMLFAVMGLILECGSTPQDNESIQIVENGNDFELTVPMSRVVLTIPKGGLERSLNPGGGAANNPRYFLYHDKNSTLTISGWFEPEKRFTSVEQLWEKDKEEWNRRGLPQPKEISRFKSGEWKAIVYGTPTPKGAGVHMRAHWVGNGTWIDLHMSMILSGDKTDSKPMFDLLEAIKVRPKK